MGWYEYTTLSRICSRGSGGSRSVPCKQNALQTQLRGLAAGARINDDDRVRHIGKFAVRLGDAFGVDTALVAHRHIGCGARDIALAVISDSETSGVAVGASADIDIATPAAAAAKTRARYRRISGATRRGGGRIRAAQRGERTVAAIRVVGGVRQILHVRIGIRRIRFGHTTDGDAVLTETERTRPGMLAIVGTRAAGHLGVRSILVDIENVGSIVRILSGPVQHHPGIFAARARIILRAGTRTRRMIPDAIV